MTDHRIGIIGGSGLYEIEGFHNRSWKAVSTPYGAPSDEFLCGEIAGRNVVFLPRHGRGHRLLPSELNHRANIWAMKDLGVSWIISVSAVGSLQKQYQPRSIVVIDQFYDRTKRSGDHTFFGQGIVAHIGFAHPICEDLRSLMLASARRLNLEAYDGGVYVNMEGPAFSTKAESMIHRKLGFDVVGMTNLAEAKLAREAEISYATLAMVTDYDCWNEDEEHVSVELVIENLHRNADDAKNVILDVVPSIPETPQWMSHKSLQTSIMTARELWPAPTIERLRPILRRFL